MVLGLLARLVLHGEDEVEVRLVVELRLAGVGVAVRVVLLEDARDERHGQPVPPLLLAVPSDLVDAQHAVLVLVELEVLGVQLQV